jgi:hypothetical protein
MIAQSSRRIMRTVLAVTAATTILVAAVPAIADACTVANTTESQPFAQFGDTSLYTLAPGGSFENATAGWTLKGASVQTGNESYHVNSPTDSHSLLIPPTSDPISAPICVSKATPTFRFFAREASGSWAEMNINVLWRDSSGVSHVTTAGGLSPSSNWAPTPIYDLGAMLPLWQPGSTLSVRIQFVPASTGGALAIDDLYIDPYST